MALRIAIKKGICPSTCFASCRTPSASCGILTNVYMESLSYGRLPGSCKYHRSLFTSLERIANVKVNNICKASHSNLPSRYPTITALLLSSQGTNNFLLSRNLARIQLKQARKFTTTLSKSSYEKAHLINHKNMFQVSNLTNHIIDRFLSMSRSLSTSEFLSDTNAPMSHSKLDHKCIKSVVVNACGELYNDLSKKRPDLYGSAPKGSGINFKIDYYDSHASIKNIDNSNIPTVCILHGAPGHYNEFTELINYLTKKNTRVVAPNFPDYSHTLNYSFRHSPNERVDLLMEFFRAIEVNTIDMIIGHSSAVYTVFQLLEQSFKPKKLENRLELRALGLFSTPTYNLPSNLAVTPLRMFALRLFDYPVLRPFIKATIEMFVKLQGIRNRVDKNNIENLLIAASAVGYSNSETSRVTLELIKEEKVPIFVLYGLNDRLIPKSSFEQLKRDLGIDDNQVKRYDANGILVHDVVDNINDQIEASEFASGGHYAFQRFTSQVNEDVYNFLRRKVLSKVTEQTKL